MKRESASSVPASRGWLLMANDLSGMIRTPHRRTNSYVQPIFGTDSPSSLTCAPFRNPFVAVRAFLIARRHRRRCARLKRTAVFPRDAAYRCARFLPSPVSGGLPVSLPETHNDLRDRFDSSFSLAPRHNS